jgi:hypothetical protein
MKAIATEPQRGLCFHSASVLQHAEGYGVQPGAHRFIGFIRELNDGVLALYMLADLALEAVALSRYVGGPCLHFFLS